MSKMNFNNQPPLDWSKDQNRKEMEKALFQSKKEFGKEYPIIIEGKSIYTGEWINSLNPANTKEVVGRVAKANYSLADRAIQAARAAQKSWRKDYKARVEVNLKAAEIMRNKRFELAALAVHEAGKNWMEADGDVCEAIDFLEYYGQQMLKLGEAQLTEVQIPGERNSLTFIPRGIGLALGIWNFACAINTGMVSAILVAGNGAVFKPASLSPVMGYKIAEIFQEAGLPAAVLNFVPGSGKDVGEHLVRHPDINLIVFTGSREAGLRIDKLAALYPHRKGIKKRILETGGKNAIIVDSDADLDEAIKGTISSWLGFQGQKCSACSRLIILEDIHDRFTERLIEAAKSVKMGPPKNPANFMGPVIDGNALKKIQNYIEIGKQEGKLAFCQKPAKELKEMGFYPPLAIFTEVSPRARIAQEEIFGPVLAVIKVKTFEQALEVANSTDYTLTGGIYSRSPKHLQRVDQETDDTADNFYKNRKITAATVGLQPFGGHNASGTGPKAGGPYYLPAFMVEKIITENIMRRGFAPI